MFFDLRGVVLKTLILPLVVLFVVGLNLNESKADVIASYSFPADAATVANSEHTSNFMATDIAGSGGGAASSTTGTGFFRGSDTTGTNNLTDAIANDEYFSFTIEAPEDCNATNIEISYDWVPTDNDGNTTINYSTFLLTDATGFTDADAIGSAFNDDINNPNSNLLVNGVNNDIGELFDETQNVSGELGAGFSLSSGDTLEVRIYFNDNSAGTQRFHRLDNVVVTADLTGAAHVPEPAAGLMLAGLFGMTVIQRRRKR